MKWLFIGEAGSSTRTHFDVLNSSAWLWCARGLKKWRCMHGGDHQLIPDACWRSGEFPDLFDPNVEGYPWLQQVRLFYGIQKAGDIMYTPPFVLHGVRNLEFTISITHNFVDAVNLFAVLEDRLLHYIQHIQENGPDHILQALQ